MYSRNQFLGLAVLIRVAGLFFGVFLHVIRLPGYETSPPVQTNLEAIAWWAAGLGLLAAAAIFAIGRLVDRGDRW